MWNCTVQLKKGPEISFMIEAPDKFAAERKAVSIARQNGFCGPVKKTVVRSVK